MVTKKQLLVVGVPAVALIAIVGAFLPQQQPSTPAASAATPPSSPISSPKASNTPMSQTTSSADIEATSAGLDFGHAYQACDAKGSQEFPYGFTAHWLLDGVYRIEDDHWFLKAGGKTENAYGNKLPVTVECVVNGSNEAPVVSSFNVY